VGFIWYLILVGYYWLCCVGCAWFRFFSMPQSCCLSHDIEKSDIDYSLKRVGTIVVG